MYQGEMESYQLIHKIKEYIIQCDRREVLHSRKVDVFYSGKTVPQSGL